MAKLIFISLFIFLTQSMHARTIHHMRVIWHERPSTQSYIAWTTKGPKPVFKSKVCFDTVPRDGNISEYQYCQKPFIQKPITFSFSLLHAVKLKNLKPNTKYYFTIKSGKTISKEYHFITAPSGNTPFELLFGGDSRSDRETRREVNKLMGKMFEDNPKIYALVHGGDYINNGLSWKQWKAWLEDHQLTTTSNGRVLPIVPTRGNHEFSKLIYDDIFLWPGRLGQPNYFKTKIGKLSILTLNTNWIHAGKQKRWLKKQLQKESKESTWIVTNYHRPAWPAVKRPGKAKKHWVPLFEDYQVDLVFESDGHTLKRTAPIYRGKIDHQKGITYVGEGGLGVKQRTPKHADAWYFQSPGYAVSKHHVMRLHVEAQKMDLHIHLLDGSIFDSINMKPRNRSKLLKL